MRVLLTGGNGMLARAIRAAWTRSGRTDELIVATRADADLRDQAAVRALVGRTQPDLVVHTAARVGGIAANVADPSGFLMDNIVMDANLLSAATEAGVRRFLYFGSSCMYPKDYRQPLVEGGRPGSPPRADERGLRSGQDHVRSLLRVRVRSTRVRLPRRDPLEPLWTPRRLLSRARPPRGGDDREGAPREGIGRHIDRRLGRRNGAPRVHLRRRSRRLGGRTPGLDRGLADADERRSG
ncbi:NAD-dependent epimerase/dehydratase family protein [Microbacterium sp. 4R-513]|nr:NAD-dependent epimerase/dehydratase family protein [Microbacterium sp. 4R-513]